jgi:hypothetical protein
MLHLMEMNGGRHRYFLTGEEEVAAFDNREFIRMHQSTLCKVVFFKTVIELANSGRLRTASKGVLHFADRLLESRSARLVALVSSVLGILTGAFSVWPTL